MSFITSQISTALITGAGAGLGLALVREFYAANWQVVGLVHRESQVKQLVEFGSDRIHAFAADVTNETCTDMIAEVLDSTGGKLSVLINNAGNPGGHPLDPIDPDQISSLFATHCVGTLRCSKACIPYLRANAGGWIVNISSRLGSLQRNAAKEFASERRSYAYRIAKASVNMATLCMAQDDALANIRVIAIHPGQMSTKMGIADAPHTSEESAQALVQRLLSNSDFESGHFYDLYGEEIPW